MKRSSLYALAQVRNLCATGMAREIRDSHSLTLADLAAHIGVSATTVHDWERGAKRPTGDRALRYYRLLTQLERRRQTRPSADDVDEALRQLGEDEAYGIFVPNALPAHEQHSAIAHLDQVVAELRRRGWPLVKAVHSSAQGSWFSVETTGPPPALQLTIDNVESAAGR